MKRQIAIHEVAEGVLIRELEHLIEHFLAIGHARCRVLFGWHWGMDYYPTNKWDYLDLTISDLLAEVQKVQDSGIGRIGGDDLHIAVPPLQCEFCFCHHDGIHLSYENPSDVTDHFVMRWRTAGFVLTERECADEG